jgi:hypothetical protein
MFLRCAAVGLMCAVIVGAADAKTVVVASNYAAKEAWVVKFTCPEEAVRKKGCETCGVRGVRVEVFWGEQVKRSDGTVDWVKKGSSVPLAWSAEIRVRIMENDLLGDDELETDSERFREEGDSVELDRTYDVDLDADKDRDSEVYCEVMIDWTAPGDALGGVLSFTTDQKLSTKSQSVKVKMKKE